MRGKWELDKQKAYCAGANVALLQLNFQNMSLCIPLTIKSAV